MKTISVKLRERAYNIYIKRGILKEVPRLIEKLNPGNFGVVITSSKINSLYAGKLKRIFKTGKYLIIAVPDGEKAKTSNWLFKIIDTFLKSDGSGRKVFAVCLGGGVVGDLGGFAAAIYKRGIPCIQIPTTLLAQIDSGIGGKTAIDLPQAKNILGSFHQPKAVYIDPDFLKTLPGQQIKEGLAEAVKYGVIRDRSLFSFLENNVTAIMALEPGAILRIISACVSIKAKIVSSDERETRGIRTILNFGHTFAHALESARGYKKISHGKAVSLGMLYAAELSYRLKQCRLSDVERIKKILACFSLPVRAKFNPEQLLKSFIYDKKFISGSIRMVLLREIGRVSVVNNIPIKTIRATLKFFSK